MGVEVDFELRGCPINKRQLLEVLNALLNDRSPNVPAYSECIECKRRGTVCVMVAKGVPCLGPVTQAGCDNLCPSHARGCFGCFGPTESVNTASLADRLAENGAPRAAIRDLFRSFNAEASAFRKASEAHE